MAINATAELATAISLKACLPPVKKSSVKGFITKKAVSQIHVTVSASQPEKSCLQFHMNQGKVVSETAPEPVGLYPHARRVGNLLFLSGIGPRKRATQQIPGVTCDEHGTVIDYDIQAQCRSVFENVRTVLTEAGSSWDRIVDVTVFLTNIQRDFAAYNKIYAEYFADNQPCRTTVEVNALPTPIAIELKCIATIDD